MLCCYWTITKTRHLQTFQHLYHVETTLSCALPPFPSWKPCCLWNSIEMEEGGGVKIYIFAIAQHLCNWLLFSCMNPTGFGLYLKTAVNIFSALTYVLRKIPCEMKFCCCKVNMSLPSCGTSRSFSTLGFLW